MESSCTWDGRRRLRQDHLSGVLSQRDKPRHRRYRDECRRLSGREVEVKRVSSHLYLRLAGDCGNPENLPPRWPPSGIAPWEELAVRSATRKAVYKAASIEQRVEKCLFDGVSAV